MNEGTAIHAAIKRPEIGIETLLEGYTVQEPEEARRLEVTEGGCNYKTLLRKCEEYLTSMSRDDRMYNFRPAFDDILTPAQINTFLRMTTVLEECEKYTHYASMFINRLIQNSYNAGYNDFLLDLTGLNKIHSIGEELQGTAKRQIAVTITGNTGNFCGQDANHAQFTIQKIDKYQYGCGWGAADSTFKTADPETFVEMLASVCRNKTNKVVFIQKYGSEEVIER